MIYLSKKRARDQKTEKNIKTRKLGGCRQDMGDLLYGMNSLL